MRSLIGTAALAFAAATAQGIAVAGDAFSIVDPFRTYYVSANVAARGADGGVYDFDVPDFANTPVAGVLDLPFIHQHPIAVSPDGTATVTGDVTFAHLSNIDSHSVSFESSVSAFINATTTHPDARGFGSSFSGSRMDVTFDVPQPVAVELSMHSALTGPSVGYGIKLVRGDVVVWDAESVIDPATGAPTTSFSRMLTLDPGRYQLSAGLSADARIGQLASAGSAGFVLAPVAAVPEAGSWLLMLCGLVGLGVILGPQRVAAHGGRAP